MAAQRRHWRLTVLSIMEQHFQQDQLLSLYTIPLLTKHHVTHHTSLMLHQEPTTVWTLQVTMDSLLLRQHKQSSQLKASLQPRLTVRLSLLYLRFQPHRFFHNQWRPQHAPCRAWADLRSTRRPMRSWTMTQSFLTEATTTVRLFQTVDGLEAICSSTTPTHWTQAWWAMD